MIFFNNCSGFQNQNSTSTAESNNLQSTCGWSTSSLDKLTYGNNLSIYHSLTDTFGNRYMTGSAIENDIQHWVIYKSTNYGVTWKLVYDVGYSTKTSLDIIAAFGYRLALGANNKIFAFGGYAGKAKVIASSNNGESWSQADIIARENERVDPGPIKANGNIVITIISIPSEVNSIKTWMVRRSTDNGVTWNTAYTSDYNDTEIFSADRIDLDSDGVFYASGSVTKLINGVEESNSRLGLRKSIGDGLTWSIVYTGDKNTENLVTSDFSLDATKWSYAAGLYFHTSDKGNSRFLFGYSEDSQGVLHGIIRRSMDGINWVTVKDVPNRSVGHIVSDTLGNLYAVFQIQTVNESANVYKSSDNGITWVEIDSFLFKPEEYTYVLNMEKDSKGDILMTGWSMASYGTPSSSFIRKFSGECK